MDIDPSNPWTRGVRGEQVLPLINASAPVIRVSAGPGTGKTFGLARRVVRLLHGEGDGLDGPDVLVVAFNRVIAADLARNIAAELAHAGHSGDPPEVRTVHALCLATLQAAAPRLLLPDEVDCMLYDVHSEHEPIRLRYPTFNELSQALREYEANREDHPVLRQGVERWLKRHEAVLVSDLPERLRSHLDSGDAPEARYQAVVVDEFQDLTPGEQELVSRLRHPGGELVALGDPRQSIYNFRGNDREGLQRLEDLTGDSVLDVPMTECQRCPPEIVDAANTCVALYGHTAMVAGSDKPANIHAVHWNTPASESNGMAKAIASNMATFPSERHLVMATRRRWAYALRDELKAIDPDIPVEVTFAESILETWQAREAFYFYCLLADPDPATWRGWLSYRTPTHNASFQAPRRSADAYLRFLASSADDLDETRILQLASERRTARRGAGGAALWDRANRFVELANSNDWSGLEPEDLIGSVFDPDLWNLDDSADAEAARADLGQLRDRAKEIAEEIADTPGGVNVGQGVARSLRYQIATRKPFDEIAEEDDRSLTITTLWGAKGLTADHVYVIGLCDEAMPGSRPPAYRGSTEEHYDEQRRLFYVTLTRTTRTLVLSRPRKIKNGEIHQLRLDDGGSAGQWHRKLTASRFVRDIAELRVSRPGEEWDGCVAYITMPTP